MTDLKNPNDSFGFSILIEDWEIFSLKNKKVFSVFKIETPKNIWLDQFVCLRSKMYAFNCGDENKKNKRLF